MPTVAGTSTPVDVLHRLALGITLRDHVTGRPTLGRPSVVEERPRRDQIEDPAAIPELRPLESWGGSRFKLRYALATPLVVKPPDAGGPPEEPVPPRQLRIRVSDPLGYYVPRRAQISIRPLRALLEAEDPPGAPPPAPTRLAASYRSLELTLFPGANYPLPPGATALRGQLLRDRQPVAWARVALHPAANPAIDLGWSHADGQGQFILSLGGVRPPSRLDSRLRGPFLLAVTAPEGAPPVVKNPRDADPLAGLPSAQLPDLADPPAAAAPASPQALGDFPPPEPSTVEMIVVVGDIRVGRVRSEIFTLT